MLNSREKNELAGKDWLKHFQHKDKILNLKLPEPTSLAKEIAFNKVM